MAGSFFIFGAGYSGLAIAAELRRLYGESAVIYGTTRQTSRLPALRAAGITPLLFDGQNFASAASAAAAQAALQTARFCFITIPPARTDTQAAAADFAFAPALTCAAANSAALQSLIYLSTIGVYGDTQGAWIDETAPLNGDSPQNSARQKAEAAWADLAAKRGIPGLILRCGGIYGGNLAAQGHAARGLSRSPFSRIAAGEARAIIKQGQVFNRIHVADIASAACYLAASGASGIFNLCDGAPCPPQDFLNFAAALMGKAPLPQLDFADADLTPAARAFYRNNRRVSNAKLLASGYQLLYPDYKSGLTKIYQSRNW